MHKDISDLIDDLYCKIVEDGLETYVDNIISILQTIKDLKIPYYKIYGHLIPLISLIRLFDISNDLLEIIVEVELELSKTYYNAIRKETFDTCNIYYIGYQKVLNKHIK